MARLDNPEKVRREACRLYWCARKGELPANDAARLASILSLVATLLRDAELCDRVTALEARL